jgi:hypothetical protein
MEPYNSMGRLMAIESRGKHKDGEFPNILSQQRTLETNAPVVQNRERGQLQTKESEEALYYISVHQL